MWSFGVREVEVESRGCMLLDKFECIFCVVLCLFFWRKRELKGVVIIVRCCYCCLSLVFCNDF